MDKEQIKPNMKVVDTHDHAVGTVDRIEGDIIDLARKDFADGLHHFVPLAAVKQVDGDTVIVEPGVATTVEAVTASIEYAHAHPAVSSRIGALFGVSGHGTGFGGSGIGD